MLQFRSLVCLSGYLRFGISHRPMSTGESSFNQSAPQGAKTRQNTRPHASNQQMGHATQVEIVLQPVTTTCQHRRQHE